MDKVIILKQGKEQFVQRFHPWVFSGAIARIMGKPQDGDLVQVLDARQNYLATGHYHQGSIAVKIIAYTPTQADANFWQEKLRAAFEVRQLLDLQTTNCYRLVHGEGDGCPGLIIDFYNGIAVLQAHSIGMHLSRHTICEALQQIYSTDLQAVYDKSAETLPTEYASTIQNGYLFGSAAVPHAVLENGHTFLINWETGQKTGFFLDQRDNRALLARYAKGKQVLNAFCYSGGFSVYALKAGATEVTSVDVSQKAIDLTNQNVMANFQLPISNEQLSISNTPISDTPIPHSSYAEDVMKFLKSSEELYDVMVLDPPAYAKSIDARHRAVKGYKRLNAEGMKKLVNGGILFTFSCSQVVDRELFYNTIVAAALEAGRQVRVLHHLSQPSDHPVNFFHPEGSYLKGLVLYVS